MGASMRAYEMIVEFHTTSGAMFRFDRELMTWERIYKSDVRTSLSYGKLYMWPAVIEVGKSVLFFKVDKAMPATSMLTTPVTSIAYLNRDEPEMKSDATV